MLHALYTSEIVGHYLVLILRFQSVSSVLMHYYNIATHCHYCSAGSFSASHASFFVTGLKGSIGHSPPKKGIFINDVLLVVVVMAV